ncbi:MAG TPA: hypothetical protein VN428_24400 [Bryobacteraceae bacterium]|nr:hypothetical protein [Bryobacteraceae bacterium]
MLAFSRILISLSLTACLTGAASAQIYSPKVLRRGQPDASDLQSLAKSIYAQSGARTPRERAEAIWRFFLTDGRFVPPGFWYHIAGWAYEEPRGEVLDPVRLLNSYGFGLCYQVAPLLAAVWKAGGFEDARVWFLTGHTVAEVFYDGAYHHFDSDVMGYNITGKGPVERASVASVAQIESDGDIILGKLRGPRDPIASLIPYPWYPADVRAGAMADVASLFTTRNDNHLFPFDRAPGGHSMDLVLRPGEKLIRYFEPERPDVFYLPYKWTGRSWEEFPREIAEYDIRTAAGPRSQKDDRRWGTGRLEYRPAVTAARRQVFDVASPYVIIDARFEFQLDLPAGQSARAAVSIDGGHTWAAAGAVTGPHQGRWTTAPQALTRSAHGSRTAVAGRYAYECSLTLSEGARLGPVLLTTRVQLNPRTLPDLKPGPNELTYSNKDYRRRLLPVDVQHADQWATHSAHARFIGDGAQGYWIPEDGSTAEFTFRMNEPDGSPLSGFTAGGHFLDLTRGVAPDKFNAEIRSAAVVPAASSPSASIAWSSSPDGPFTTIWEFDPKLVWRDGKPVDRVLPWPEIDRHVALRGAREAFVRYRFSGMAVDDLRLAVESAPAGKSSGLAITHVWKENGVEKRHVERILPGALGHTYSVQTRPDTKIENVAVIFESGK